MVLPVIAGAIARGAAIAAGEELAATAGEALAARLASMAMDAMVDGHRVVVKVNSSAIIEASFEPESRLMTITFNSGKEYDFPDYDEGTFTGLVTAASPGAFYNENIKGRSGGGVLRGASNLAHGLMSHWR